MQSLISIGFVLNSISSLLIILELLKINQNTTQNHTPTMNSIQLPPINPLLAKKIEPRLMKDTYKKVHIYLFDFDVVLGKGSFSKVYKGINLNTNEQVAVKVIEMNSINTPKLKQLLLQQIDILMKVKHQNLIKSFEVLSSTKNTYIIMELCTYDLGSICDFIQKESDKEKNQSISKQNNRLMHTFDHKENLNQVSRQSTQYTVRNKGCKSNENRNLLEKSVSSINSISSTESIEFYQAGQVDDLNSGQQSKQNLKEQKFYPYIKQIYLGLEYLSSQNMVHRDLKLSNIFLTSDKACKIGDFGFATIMHENQIQIKDTCCIGSPLYMSPESYLENIYSLKSDIWSFGILIFEMIFGNPPHWNCPSHEVLQSQIKKPINLSKFQRIATISQELKEVLQGCLQVEVRKRFNISELKQTRLFKRLFYQPLQSNVIVSSRDTRRIEESNVQVIRTLNRNESIKIFDRKEYEFNNFSTIEKVKLDSKGMLSQQNERQFLNMLRGDNKNQIRKQQKCQTIHPFNSPVKMYEDLENNSMTDRINFQHDSRNKSVTASKHQVLQRKISNNQALQSKMNQELRFRQTDLNGNIFKGINKKDSMKQDMIQAQKKDRSISKRQFSYKNSQQMQKYLKDMKDNRKNELEKQAKNLNLASSNEKLITFTDLTNTLGSPKENNSPTVTNNQEKKSPRFTVISNNSFFVSPRYDKNQHTSPLMKNLSKTSQSFSNQKPKEETLMSRNHSMLQNNQNIKPITSLSPRHDYQYYFKKDQKENSKEETLLTKNYSLGAFSTTNQNYTNSKESGRYEYKMKILEKCTSSPKFETLKTDSISKETQDYDNDLKQMTTSSYFGIANNLSSPKSTKYTPTNNVDCSSIKQESLRDKARKVDEITKSYEGNKNFLAQFSSKLKQNSHIQKRTYWKGNNHKNLTINLGQNTSQLKQNTNQISSLKTSRNNSLLYATSTEEQQTPPTNKKSAFCKAVETQSASVQPFRLLNGEFLIKDACELINFTRLLHKISFLTQKNSNSILLLQYSIQVLYNLLQKCDNFEIKYHYDSFQKNSQQIREAFKVNEAFLNNLCLVNEKQCYSIKKDMSSGEKENSSSCNKTIQLKLIIQSYMKKFQQRKQALVKLFECNVIFEKLTNKVKDTQSVNLSFIEKTSAIKRSSFASEKGFLNFSKLQKALQQIGDQIIGKKDNSRLYLPFGSKNQGQSLNLKFIISLASIYVDIISKCTHERSFFNFSQHLKIALKMLSKIDYEFFKNLDKGSEFNEKSLIQKLLSCFSNDLKDNQRTNLDGSEKENGLMVRNMSVLIGNAIR